MFFDQKTLFIVDKQCFSIYYTSGLQFIEWKAEFLKKHNFQVDKHSLSTKNIFLK